MLNLPAAATLHLERESRRLTVAGVVYRRDGVAIRCTQHDEDLEIETGPFAGVYFSNVPVTASDVKSSADLSVDNMEISGAIQDSLTISGFTVQDIEAGQFNNAPFETFLLQWDAPDAWQKVIRRGYLGQISRTAEGEFQAEWRGIIQVLQQIVGRTYSELCDVKRFGDARCGANIAALTLDATITAVTSRRRFDVALIGTPAGAPLTYLDLGELKFDAGANSQWTKQIKRGSVNGALGQMELWEPEPIDPEVGDVVHVVPGCARRFSDCQFFDRVVSFRGHGFWAPGIPNIIRAP